MLCRNDDPVHVVDLRQSFSLEDHHGPAHANMTVTRGTNFHGLLTDVVDGAVWWHVKCEWSFIHVNDEVQWIVVYFAAIDDVAMEPENLLWYPVISFHSQIVTQNSQFVSHMKSQVNFSKFVE